MQAKQAPFQSTVIDQIIVEAEKNKFIDIVWLYGSQAKGLASKESDYDLAVALSNEAKAGEIESLVEDISYHWTEKLEREISVVNINKIPVPLAYSVITDGEVIFCDDNLRLHTEESRIWALWESYRYEFTRK
ncbi:MAG: nucleotidyltransferase domain-containing protein [Gammaproteobacteria bacterium]|nr:nucleotidyltransferase domain-containing protein [Gammaproteobacteria bacterium]